MAILKRHSVWSPRLVDATGEEPEMGYVSIGELHLDHLRWSADGRAQGYQHNLDEGRVQAYMDAFDPHLLGAITCNRRTDGSLYVIDGQHRVEVLRRLGKSVAFATVYNGLTPEQEADTFYRLNTARRSPNMWTQFGARASAPSKYPRVAAIIDLARECGFRTGVADRSLDSIAAVSTLERIYDWPNGPRLLRTALTFVATMWPTTTSARDGIFIEGLARFIYTWDMADIEGNKIDWVRFNEIFSKTDAPEILRRAKSIKYETGIDLNAGTYALAFRDLYNGTARFRRRLEGRPAYPTKTGIRRMPASRSPR